MEQVHVEGWNCTMLHGGLVRVDQWVYLSGQGGWSKWTSGLIQTDQGVNPSGPVCWSKWIKGLVCSEPACVPLDFLSQVHLYF